jgi:Holliday junction resolvasome RuvABC ATP-dependent DNA helicase subunit
MSEFDQIVGQERAKSRLMSSVESFKSGGMTLSPLLCAQKGGGKTVLARAYGAELEKAGAQFFQFSSPEEFREEGPEWDKLIKFFTSKERSVLFIDETHLINYKSTRRLDKARAALMKSLDKNNKGKPIILDGETAFEFKRTEKTIILATNFPRKLDPSGALQSRMDKIELDEYSYKELLEILKRMLQAQGFHHLNDGTLEIIAHCGRGNARPLEKIAEEFEILLAAKRPKVISRAEVKQALKNIKLYPFGLDESEVKILEKAAKPLKSSHINAALPQIESRAFKNSIGYLFSLELLGYGKGTMVKTTKKGIKYLQELQQHGFIDELNLPVNV